MPDDHANGRHQFPASDPVARFVTVLAMSCSLRPAETTHARAVARSSRSATASSAWLAARAHST